MSSFILFFFPLEDCVSGEEEREEYLSFLLIGTKAETDRGLFYLSHKGGVTGRKENFTFSFTISLGKGSGHEERLEEKKK